MKKQNVRTLSFIFSTFTYLLVGAAIFDALESQTEEATLKRLVQNENEVKTRFNISNDEWVHLEDLMKNIHLSPTQTFSSFLNQSSPQWKFTGAFYFSLTVITTIGYGHSTPQTVPGKLFCIIYALIGIPLCLVMFQAVGERLNSLTSWFIKMFKKTFRFHKTDVNQSELVFVGGLLAFLIVFGGAAIFTYYEGWSYFNSIYYCVVTLTTIGFGDYVALQGEKGSQSNLSNTGYLVLSLTFILFGLTVVASAFNLLVFKLLTMNTDDELNQQRREQFTRATQRNQSLRFSNTDLLNVVNGNIVCTFEPADLGELRHENSMSLCFRNTKCFEFLSNTMFKRTISNTNAANIDGKLTAINCGSDKVDTSSMVKSETSQNINRNLNFDSSLQVAYVDDDDYDSSMSPMDSFITSLNLTTTNTATDKV